MFAKLKKFLRLLTPPPILALKRKIHRYIEDKRFARIYRLRTIESFQKFATHNRDTKIKVLFYNDWGGSWEA